MRFNLLTPRRASAKLDKGPKRTDRILSAILYLSPDVRLCPWATKGCLSACLNTAGRGRFENVQTARAERVRLLREEPDTFRSMLVRDLETLYRYARRDSMRPFVRLNGTSDLRWQSILPGIDDILSDLGIGRWEYTKDLPKAIERRNAYHVTYSRSEERPNDALRAIQAGLPVAVVGTVRAIRRAYPGVPLVYGDRHDYRFLDRPRVVGSGGYIVQLAPKGKAKEDSSGFVLQGVT